MKTTSLVAFALAALSLTSAPVARAADLNSAALESGLSLSQFYSGPVGNVGSFKGKLVCLCCDLTADAAKAQACEKNGHHHALSVDGDAMVHPLITGSEEVLLQVNSDELRGKAVVVVGKYYPSTGFIFVQSVRAEK